MSSLPPTLILHFDVNKTIIMTDAASDRSLEQTLNSLISECVWGAFDQSTPRHRRTVGDWSLLPDQNPIASMARPQNSATTGNICYATFGEYLEDHTDLPKNELRFQKRSFTEKGFVGESFKQTLVELGNHVRGMGESGLQSVLQRLEQVRANIGGASDNATQLSANNKSSTAKNKTTSASGENIAELNALELLQHGYYHILPSFIDLVKELTRRKKQGLLDFRILFRTFGTDLANIAAEFNLFCTGAHPIFNEDEEEDRERYKELILQVPQRTGQFMRSYPAGQLQGPENPFFDTAFGGDVHLACQQSDGTIQIVRGSKAVHKTIFGDWFGLAGFSSSSTSTSSTSFASSSSIASYAAATMTPHGGAQHCAAIRDDFEWWADHGESCRHGKLLLLTNNEDISAGSGSGGDSSSGDSSCISGISSSGISSSSGGDDDDGGGGGGGSSSITTTTTTPSLPRSKIIQIFFDDNIERDRAHIVDCRDSDGCPVPFAQAVSQGLIKRVEPLMAISKRDYFIGEVDAVLAIHGFDCRVPRR